MKKRLRRLAHWFLAFLILPVVWGSFKTVGFLLPTVHAEGWRSWWLYGAGAGGYLLLERIFARPMRVYVFGHELTHVVSGLLSGARIHSFRAGARSGEVRLSKSNAFIALSPYILPLYSLFVVVLYLLIKHWWPSPHLTTGFQVFLGASIAFHISLTFVAVHTRQPDLKILGLFLSSVLIVVGNVLIFGLFCVTLFHNTPTVRQYAARLGQESLFAYRTSGRWLKIGAAHAWQTAQNFKEKF